MVRTYDYDGSGVERETVVSVHTLVTYEQQFQKGLIEDVFRKVDLREHADMVDEDGMLVQADYTIDNWMAYVRALWAMLRSASDLARVEGRPYEKVPPFEEWSICVSNINMTELSTFVVVSIQEDLFRSTAATSTEE